MITTPVEALIASARIAVQYAYDEVRIPHRGWVTTCCGMELPNVDTFEHRAGCWLIQLREALKPFDEQL